MCKICKDEIISLAEYKKRGEDPYDMRNVFKDVAKNLAITMEMVMRDAKKMGIDLDNLSEEDYPEPPSPNRYRVFRLVKMYADEIDRMMKSLEVVPIETNTKLILKALDVLSHSRFFIAAKTSRALSSKWEEERDKFDEAKDSKTSAYMAYIAIERNSKALTRLAVHKPLFLARKKYLKMARLSLNLMDLIKEKFFPEFDPVIYEEFGCESYDKMFGRLGEKS